MGTGLTKYRILEVDEFIAELWQVHLKVKEEGYTQVWEVVAPIPDSS